MINQALQTIRDELNEFLIRKQGAPETESRVHLCHLLDEHGKIGIPANSLGIALINLEEDRINPPSRSKPTLAGKETIQFNLPMKVNLYILIAAHYADYQEAMKALAVVLETFQTRPVLTPFNTPSLDRRFSELTMELCSYQLDQLKDVWAFLGGRYIPSVIYRAKGTVISGERIESIDARARSFVRRVFGSTG